MNGAQAQWREIEASFCERSPTINTTPPRTQKAPPIHALTSLRFIAAFMIVLYHYNVFVPYPPIIKEIMLRGIAGVSFFFILSGFVLTYNYAAVFQNSLAQYRRYIQARFARVFPAHAIALLLMTPVTIYFLEHRPDIVGLLSTNGIGIWGIIISWIANLLLVNVYIPITAFQALWNEPAWSINDEMFFYLLFPLFLRYILRWASTFRRMSRMLLIIILIQISVFMFTLGIFQDWKLLPQLDWFLARSPLLRVWEFLIGCTLGAIFLKMRTDTVLPEPLRLLAHQTQRNTLLLSTFLMVLVIIFFPLPAGQVGLILDGLKDFVLFTPVFATIILVCAVGPNLLSRLLDHPLLILLGESSYALYITHWILVMLFRRVIEGGGALSIGWYILGIVLSVVISVGFHLAIEQPLRRLFRPPLPRANSLPATHGDDQQPLGIPDAEIARI